MMFSKAHLLSLIATLSLVQAQRPAGYCTSDSDCSSLICSGKGPATCQAAGFGQSSGACTCPNGLPASQPPDLILTSAPESVPTTSASDSVPTTSASLIVYPIITSTLVGPTTFCQGLGPGGGNSCMTISAGCYAISPSYNYVPETTCTETTEAQSTQAGTTTEVSQDFVPTSSATFAPEATPFSASDSSLISSSPDSSQLSILSTSETPAVPVSSQSSISDPVEIPSASVFSQPLASDSTQPLTPDTPVTSTSDSSQPSSPISFDASASSSAPSSLESPVASISDSTQPVALSTPVISTSDSSQSSILVPSATSISGSAEQSTLASSAPPASTSSPAAIIIPDSLSTPIASATSQISAAQSAASALSSNPTDPQAAQAASSTISSALQAAQAAKDLTQDAAVAALLTSVIGPLTNAEAAAAAAVAAPSAETAAEVAAAVALAEAASEGLEDAIEGENPSSCAPEKRSIGHARRLRSRQEDKRCFADIINTVPPPVANIDEIPESRDCTNRENVTTSYNREAIEEALKLGAKYKLANKTASRGRYPKEFEQKSIHDNVTPNTICADTTLLEFPILPSGELYWKGRNAVNTAGTERVLFAFSPEEDRLFYCGLIVHDSKEKFEETGPDGKVFTVQPYSDCR